jgi:hypothetical protein
MASVIGLAPIRPGLKGRLRELLCIHGRKAFTAETEAQSGGSLARLNSETPILRGDKDTLASKLARLVGEEWAKRGDNRHESGLDEVCDHGVDVLVSGWRFFVEQIALFADHATTQRRLHELVHAEAFAHAEARLTTRPLAARTVGQ